MATRESDFLVRTEILSTRETVVSYARELDRGSIVVVTDWMPPLGAEVRLRISFLSLFEPIDVRARVVGHRPSRGVGEPAAVQLAFEFESEAAREAVARVVFRLASAEHAPAAPARDHRVLLVEDNSFIRDMFSYGVGKYFAQRSGKVEFDHAPDAATAWGMIAATRYDLVIVDYYLPAEDGAALIARIRRDERLASLPVVAISVGGRDAREATLAAGADLFLDKPVVLRDLFKTLQVFSQRGVLA